jgi:hypothetical protein
MITSLIGFNYSLAIGWISHAKHIEFNRASFESGIWFNPLKMNF